DEQERRQEDRDERPRGTRDAGRRRAACGAEVGGEGEERTRHGLRGAVAGDALRARHTAGPNHLGLEQRQHHVAAAEHERAHAAGATTATATSLSPSSQPAAPTPDARTPYAKAISATADGSVNPSHAATPPASPARSMPSAIPTWLDAGPGRNWQSATRSA